MTLRRYSPLKPSSGTRWPQAVRDETRVRDGGCVGPIVGFPDPCYGALELDHVRASGAMGRKSRSTADNAAWLCGTHHSWKTNHGREGRVALLHYLERFA